MEEGDYKRAKSILTIILVITLVIQLALYSQLNFAEDITANVVNEGTVSICIGASPILNFSDCNHSVLQGETYNCQLSAHYGGGSNLSYGSVFVYINRTFNDSEDELFIVTEDGVVEFTTDNNDVGEYTILFSATSVDSCGGGEQSNYFNLSVINVNDPPIFSGELDDLILAQDQKFYGFYLGDYFSDPDLDELLYNVTGNSQIDISGSAFYFNDNPNPSNTQVIFESSVCGISEIVYFTAIDEYDETVNSNSINITVNCDSEDDSTPSGGSSGGGGGGSGSSSGVDDTYRPLDPKFTHFKHEDCTENWNCSEWSECYPNGTMSRTCVDLANCGTTKYRPTLVDNCTYGGTCYDSIKNCHDGECEENIDCGGPCMPCKFVESPLSTMAEDEGILLYVLISLGFVLSLLGIYFRKAVINGIYSILGGLFLNKKDKQILISVKEKNELLKDLNAIESVSKSRKLYGKVLRKLFLRYGEILRNYIIYASGKNLTKEFSMAELVQKLNQSDKKVMHPIYNKELSKILGREIKLLFVNIYKKYETIQLDKCDLFDLRLFIEELRNLIIQTSESNSKDLERELITIKESGDYSEEDKVRVGLINSYIAMEFLELSAARSKMEDAEKIYAGYKKQLGENNFRKYVMDYYFYISKVSMRYVRSWYLLGKGNKK